MTHLLSHLHAHCPEEKIALGHQRVQIRVLWRGEEEPERCGVPLQTKLFRSRVSVLVLLEFEVLEKGWGAPAF